MQTDLKHLLKGYNLTTPQKRLLNAITREPTAHLYSKAFMTHHQLTRGMIASALRRLKSLNLVGQEDGVWQVQPPELQRWYKVVLEHGQFEAEGLRYADLS